jgi:serine O-acetyltransferase
MTNKQIDNIINSYEKLGIVNPNVGINYPPKQYLSNLLDSIKELLFPGFFGVESLNSSMLKKVTTQRVNQIRLVLQTELKKCLHFAKELNYNVIKNEIQIADGFINYVPQLRKMLSDDATAHYNGDPAAKSIIEVVLSYPGFLAVMNYRIANYFYIHNVPLIPRMLTEISHFQTGIDIHPGAKIGKRFCIDHGSGVVIGETSVIGDFVKLYQGVTLGAFSVSKSQSEQKRHPTLEDHVTVYAMSTILGGNTVVGKHSIVGGNVWLTRSLNAYSKIYVSEDFDSAYKLIESDK